MGLDTTVSLEGGEGGGAGVGVITAAASQSGASPFINAPPLTPETLLAPALIGVTAFQKPDEETITTQLVPRDPEWELTQRLLFSRNPQDFATGSPSVRDFRVTNASALAAIFDDNSSPISIFRASVGMYTGGPLVDKSFPAHDPTLAAPDEPHGPLYHWQNYSRVGANGAELELNDEGDPYTSRDSEVTDVRQLGRSIYQFPVNFIETYFPTRLVTDFAAMAGGDRSGDLENLRHDGPSMKPILLVQAGDSDSNDAAADEGPTQTGEKPNDKELSREAILPGYNHLDVATAAWRQNDGRPEGSSRELARFLLKVIRRARPYARRPIASVPMSAESGARLRQAVLVARDLAPVSDRLQSELGLGEPFADPGVGAFGLHNAVYAIGDGFIEVISPNQPDTTAGRYLDRRGDGGYMVIFQLADLDAARERAAEMGVRVVWQLDLPDISGTHLHPADTRGAIVSLDRADPPGSWRWGGPDWTGKAGQGAAGRLRGVTIAVADPAGTAARWAELLGVAAATTGGSSSTTHTLQFAEAEDERLTEIHVEVPGRQELVEIGGASVRITS